MNADLDQALDELNAALNAAKIAWLKIKRATEGVGWPTSIEQAEAMEKVGFAYIRQHAPEKLTEWGLERPVPKTP